MAKIEMYKAAVTYENARATMSPLLQNWKDIRGGRI